MNVDLSGKTILVTGAGAGIGKGVAQKLVSCGAKVIALSLIQKELDDLKKETPSVETICVDLLDWNATRAAVDKIPSVDGLVNNAGIAVLDNFLEAKPEDFDKTYGVNVKALINVSQIVIKKMIAQKKGGSIVNLSSIAAQSALENHAIYCGSKAAVDQTTKVMAVEFGKHKIRVNAVNPTVVLTELGKKAWSDPVKAEALKQIIPLRRFAEIDEVANAIVFLLSDLASIITGATLPLDGGYLVH